MKIKSRTVSFYEINLLTSSISDEIEKAHQTAMDDLLPFLQKHIPKGHEIPYANTPIEVIESRWCTVNNELQLLLNITDPDRSDVAYRKRTTRARRTGDKAKDEDIELSAHVVIRPMPGSATAKMAMTTGAGVPASKVVSLLTAVYKLQAKSPTITKLTNPPLPTKTLDAKGKPKTYKVRHRFELNGMPNGTLKDIIKTGKIVGVELIDTGTKPLDASSPFSVNRMQMHIEVGAHNVDVSVLHRIMRAALKNKNIEADKIRIDYKETQSSQDTEVKHKTFDAMRLNEAFTRTESITLETAHADQQLAISEEIISKVSALL